MGFSCKFCLCRLSVVNWCSLTDMGLQACIRMISGWGSVDVSEIEVETISGGITNALWKLTPPEQSNLRCALPCDALLALLCQKDIYQITSYFTAIRDLTPQSCSLVRNARGFHLLSKQPIGRLQRAVSHPVDVNPCHVCSPVCVRKYGENTELLIDR